MSERALTTRLALCGVAFALVLSGLGCRLGYLHLGAHETERSAINSDRTWKTELPVERGRIFDRRGEANILAMDLTMKDVCLDPSVVVSNGLVGPTAAALSEVLDLPADEIAVQLNRPERRYARIKTVHPDVFAKITTLGLPGLFSEDQPVRYYPQGGFMSHVLGFVNAENKGSAGVEQRLDKFLRGSHGLLESQKNGLRQELYWKRQRHIPSVEGADVWLTLDQYVQFIVEEALDAALAETHAEGIWAIVQEVGSGKILAMASRPSYDLNAYRGTPNRALLNRAVGYTFEPGSTFKAIVFSAALEEKLVKPGTMISCENGSWMHAGRMLNDFHPYGILSVEDGLKKSSNIMSAKLAGMLGDRRFESYMKEFGVGSQLGLDLPGEETGILHPVSKWSAISGSRIAIGQGVGTTALQMLGIFCTIANGGVMMRPYVIDRVVARDGTVLFHQEPVEFHRPISPATAATMRRMLARVTEEGGTGLRAQVPGYAVAGKTGTAQKAVAGGYSNTENIASFVGFLPVDDPKIGIIVVLDNPQPLRTGGRVAAPVFSTIASQLVRYLDIAPTPTAVVAQR